MLLFFSNKQKFSMYIHSLATSVSAFCVFLLIMSVIENNLCSFWSKRSHSGDLEFNVLDSTTFVNPVP